ncbi:3-dehydrosphinganine reductase [Pleurotus pulmonarius]|nr:3-dehydrosphinganine reductase [Pleurotus pulmonarius]
MLYYLLLFALSSSVVFGYSMFSNSKKWDPRGKHCYVTGGSTGLGLSLAILLTKKGADVSIVARNEERLRKALELMEKERQNPNQVLKSYSFSLNDATTSVLALETACEPHGGRCPDAVFMCAGASTPGFFVEQDERSMREGMDNGYWVQAWTAHAATTRMVKSRSRGKLVFVSSILGYMSFAGYSTYSPAKHALRGLAETLRSELLLYDIGVHILFPGTILSPGYAKENETKPKITLKIEEDDSGLQPEQVAEKLLDGVQKGHFHIASDLISDLMRSGTRGATPHNNVLLDIVYGIIGWIGLVVWRRGVDKTIVNHRKEHEEYLSAQKFFGEPQQTSE